MPSQEWNFCSIASRRKDDRGVTADRDVFSLPAPGGTLVMASCSSRVSAERFFTTLNRDAEQVDRLLREIDRIGQAIDHLVCFPEDTYLKCLFAIAA